MTDTQLAPASAPTEAHEIPIGQIFSILWRGRWIILLCTLIATGAGIWYVQKRGTIYRAKSTLHVDNQNLNVLGAESLFLGGASRNYVNTQAEALQSSKIFGKVLDLPAMRNLEIFKNVENRLLWLSKNLKVSVGKTDDVISVTLDSKHIEDACDLVNNVVTEYALSQTAQNADTRETLVNQLDLAQKADQAKLDKLTEELREFLETQGTVGPESLSIVSSRHNVRLAELSRLTEERRKLEQQLRSAKAFENEPETLLRMLASDPTTRAAAMDPVSDELRLQARTYEAQLITLRSEITDKHPGVQELQRRIEEIEAELKGRKAGFAKSYIASLEMVLAPLVKEESRLAADVAADEALVAKMTQQNLEYRNLDREINDKRVSIKTIGDRITAINLNKIDKAAELKIEIYNEASVATATVASGKSTTIAILGFLGFLLGSALAWLRGILDHRIRRVEDVAQGAGLQVVGVTPRGHFKRGTTALAAWQTSDGLAEAARSLRTAVYFAMSAGDHHILHVTSPDPGDGKSMTTASLAIAMAQAGQKTLIIDADLRKPRQDELWDVDNDYGLSDMLTQPRPKNGVIKTDQPGLDLLTAGLIPDNPAELLSSDKFDKLLAKFAKKYDRVLVDSPPVLPVADSRIIGPKCDFTLLVTRVDKTTVKRAALAREDLASVGGRLLGAVVNDMPRKIGYGYGYGYGYGGYQYGYGHKPTKERVSSDDDDADFTDESPTPNGSANGHTHGSNGKSSAVVAEQARPSSSDKPQLRRVAARSKIVRRTSVDRRRGKAEGA